MCQWRFAKHFTGFLPLPMRDMCTFDTALSLRWEKATTESFSHVNERKGKTSRKTRRRTKRRECFSCCMTLLRLLAKADCENPEKKGGRLQKQKKLGYCECLGAFYISTTCRRKGKEGLFGAAGVWKLYGPTAIFSIFSACFMILTSGFSRSKSNPHVAPHTRPCGGYKTKLTLSPVVRDPIENCPGTAILKALRLEVNSRDKTEKSNSGKTFPTTATATSRNNKK